MIKIYSVASINIDFDSKLKIDFNSYQKIRFLSNSDSAMMEMMKTATNFFKF